MREFVVTPEMKSDAEDDPKMMELLADEMERAGLVILSRCPYKFKQPFEIERRSDGSLVYRQFEKQ